MNHPDGLRVQPVPSVDIERYAGRWYEISHLPNRFQRQCSAETTAEYSPRPDGRLTVVNRCRRADGTFEEVTGVARKRDKPPGGATFKVRFAPGWLSFIPQVWGDYWILALPEDYRYAVVGEPSRKYLWILSRTPRMSESDYAAAVEAAERNGYDTRHLVKTRQPVR
ncbi:MAG: lipocalin family protein [Vicinamibacterales bacterium]